MQGIGVKLVAMTATLALLGACVPEQGAVQAPKEDAAVAEETPPPPPQLQFAQNYISTSDGEFTVPAVPVEKVPLEMLRQEVAFASDDPPGTIIIDPASKSLHLVTGPNRAMRYGIAVGRDGFQWSGEANITARKTWPTWTPPKEMIERKPELVKWEKGQPGGPENPLGARALYLTTNGVDYGYRIHGTPEWWSIGSNASSGCIRMINQDVMDLYNRVPDGAKVVVLNSDGTRPTKLTLPPPAPKPEKKVKKKAAKPVVVEPVVVVPKPAVMPTPVITGAPATAATPTVAPVVAPAATPAPIIIVPTPTVTPAPVVTNN